MKITRLTFSALLLLSSLSAFAEDSPGAFTATCDNQSSIPSDVQSLTLDCGSQWMIPFGWSYTTQTLDYKGTSPLASLNIEKGGMISSVLGESTVISSHESWLVYLGNDVAALKKVKLYSWGVLELIGNLGTYDASYTREPGSFQPVVTILGNNDTHYTAISSDNFTFVRSNPTYNPNPHIHLYTPSDDGWEYLFLMGLDKPAIVEFDTTIPHPVDFSRISDKDVDELYSGNIEVFYAKGNGQMLSIPYGIVQVGADQTASKLSKRYPVEVLKGVTLNWDQPTTAPFAEKTWYNKPSLIGDGMVQLRAPNATWGNDDFHYLDDSTHLTVVFGSQGPDENIHTLSDTLPKRFAIATHTLVNYNTTTAGAVTPVSINPVFLEGTLHITDHFDFKQTRVFHGDIYAIRGNGKVRFDTANFSNPEGLISKRVHLGKTRKTISMVLNGDTAVTVKGKDYHYGLLKQTENITNPAIITQVGDRQLYNWWLTLIPNALPQPPAPYAEILSLAQPPIEAQIRLDASRLNRDLWHPERITPNGFFAWANALGTFQQTGKLQSFKASGLRYSQKTYGVGLNIGAAYAWQLDNGQRITLSSAIEGMRGVRKVGNEHFQEKRFNIAAGARWQGDKLYGALSAQWAYVRDQVPAHEVYLEFNRSQRAWEASAEVGLLDLHVTSLFDLTPYVQYNWTKFDKEWASSAMPEQHLHLGAYLTMPWYGQDIAITNKLGLSTIISVLGNDAASFQAYWSLRLGGPNFGVELHTTTEYAPADQRRAVELGVGMGYVF